MAEYSRLRGACTLSTPLDNCTRMITDCGSLTQSMVNGRRSFSAKAAPMSSSTGPMTFTCGVSGRMAPGSSRISRSNNWCAVRSTQAWFSAPG